MCPDSLYPCLPKVSGESIVINNGEIFFNTVRYRSSETIQLYCYTGYFQSDVSYIKVQLMFT